jgi:hypothetical protein
MQRSFAGRRSLTLTFLVLALGALLPTLGDAQDAGRASGLGYELALFGTPQATYGETLRVQGIAYEVRGLAELLPLAQGEVVARLTSIANPRTGSRDTVVTRTVVPGAGGRFEVALDVPERALAAPILELVVRRRGATGREYGYSLSIGSPLGLDLLTDRVLYEPGESVRAWSRLLHAADGAPVGARRVTLSVTDPSGRRIAEQLVTTSAAGIAALEAPLPASAADGMYTVSAQALDGVATAYATRGVRVGRRTVERLLLSATLDQSLVPPSGRLSGRVSVRTPSGAAVRGARVEVRVSGRGEPLVLESDGEGLARFRTTAPAFLSGDVATQTVDVRATHPAHGTLRTTVTYQLARVEWVVSATAAAGALVPEVDTEIYVAVSDPRGRPAPANTPIVAAGPGVRGGSAQATTDANGLAVVPMRLPRGAAATVTGGGAGCNGQVATVVDVTINTARPLTARVCVRAAPDAEVLARVIAPVVAPGGELAFDVRRRDSVRGRAVLAEALAGEHVVGATWLTGSETRGVITLPAGLAGLVSVRVRALGAENALAPSNEPGFAGTGAGALDAVLVRPADAFALRVETGDEIAHVRTRARVALRTDTPRQGWAALVARDLAAHGGETEWSLAWLGGVLQSAASKPNEPGSERVLRSALAATLSPDSTPVRPPALVPRPGAPYAWFNPGQAQARGQLRDPVALRGEFLRRGLGPAMQTLERAVAALDGTPASERGIVTRAGSRVSFDPNVVENLVSRGMLSDSQAKTLGDTRLTVAMLTQADPSFTFDTVARRLARARLVTLLVALSRFTNPDDENAARAASGEPPERWLSKLVRLGLITPQTLVDPWGRPYAFRRAGGAGPAVVIAQAAPEYECVSAGPDGTFGNGDDVRDPFARAVTRGTPFAVTSGEDNLMEQLAALGPGAQVLAAMAGAYDAVALAAREEARHSVVTATASEAAPSEANMDDALGGLALDGEEAMGGSGYAARSAPRGMAMPSVAPPPSPAQQPQRMRSELAAAEAARDADGEPDAEDARNASVNSRAGVGSRLAVMGELVRERFPATLFVSNEVALDRSGATIVEVPVADALTTYLVEAIAWTASGWTTSASGEIRVDQDAMVDAPVPPFATTNDVLRLPVRVANRTATALSVRVEVSAEGGLDVTAPAPRTVEVPPNDAVEVLTEVRLGARTGEGAVVVRAVRASDGSALDAVRRPLVVWQDARLVRVSTEQLLDGTTTFDVTVPADASARGPGELRVTVGRDLFGDPAVWGAASNSSAAAWALLLSGGEVPDALRAESRNLLAGNGDDDVYGGYDLEMMARAVGVAWTDDALGEPRLRAGLRMLGGVLSVGDPSEPRAGEIGAGLSGDGARIIAPPPPPPPGGNDPQTTRIAAHVLAMLAPAVRAASHRPAVKDDLARLVRRVRAKVEQGAAALSESPGLSAECAAALALSAPADDRNARARELLRRAERGVISVADRAFLDPDDGAPVASLRVAPTAWLAIARALLSGRAAALAPVRELVSLRRGAPRWDDATRALATAAVALVSGRSGARDVRVRVDGQDVAVREDGGAAVAVLLTIAQPGTHHIEVRAAAGSVALAFIDARYGRPWDAPAARSAPIALGLSGAIGPRDGRAGLRLEVRNRGARVLSAPIAEVDLPAGAELDEATRERLGALTAAPPTLEGRTLRLRLRPIAPGGFARIPLPVRWATGGVLRGLGVTAFDDANPSSLEGPPVAVLPSRGVEVADRGTEPREVEGTASPEPEPPPPPPPILYPLSPVSIVPAGVRTRGTSSSPSTALAVAEQVSR